MPEHLFSEIVNSCSSYCLSEFDEPNTKTFCCIFRLDTGHVDLYLIHSPYGGEILRTYDAMLELKAQGLVRCILYHSLSSYLR